MISFNSFLITYLSAYAVTVIADLWIEKLNTENIKKHGENIPQAFEGIIDEKELGKINQYTIDNTHFSTVQTIVSSIVFLLIILSGILPWLTEALTGINYVMAGLIFLAVPGLLAAIVSLPFDYYHSFVIEERYGFNTKTIKIWITDLIKALVLSLILGAILLSSVLLMIRYTGEIWWIWACAVFLGFQLLMTVLYPTVIAPIFNKFTPLEDPDLVKKIEVLAESEGLGISGIYQMDATKRSRHTNAYFSGLGKTKRIVLYDSLIQSHDEEELLSVLAHEIGHLKKNHIKKQFVITCLISILLFYLASKMITWDVIFHSFGFSLMPAYAGLFLVGVLWEPVGFFLSPIAMATSRKFEREADLYAFQILKTAEPFIRALKKMAKDNLSNLRPNRLYVWFNYSHPPLLERIKRLEAYSSSED